MHAYPTFELTGKPWFGPKARAKELLSMHRSTVAKAGPAALSAMADILGDVFVGIQHVRFIDFRMNGDFWYTIAVCWTEPDSAIRDALYDLGPGCVAATGWYPLPQGERLFSAAAARRLGPGVELPYLGGAGLASITAAASGPDAGTAVRVNLSDGRGVLLDSGFGRQAFALGTDRLVLISHHHRDHIGGLESNQAPGIPAGMAPSTAVGLQAQRRLDPIHQRNPLSWLEPGVTYDIGDRLTVTAMVVPHTPGSVGYVLDDSERTLVYTGDIALQSARHDAIPDLLAAVPAGRQATVLLDATMAGRREGVSNASPARQVVDQLSTGDVAVIAHYDHLLYAYLDIFFSVKESPLRNQVHFLVTRRAKPLFQQLHDAFIRRQLDALDPLLTGQYGASMTSWGESRWLYWFDGELQVPVGRKVWFVTPDEYENSGVPTCETILTIGRVDIPGTSAQKGMIDTTPWTGHSDQPSLAAGIRAFQSSGHRVVLFHNFTKRISKFCRDHDLDAVALTAHAYSL